MEPDSDFSAKLREDCANVMLPLTQACTLPPSAYTSAAFFARERQRVFADAWLFVGHGDDVSEAGSYYTTQTALGPLVLTRDGDGVLRAFVNSCRHRGTAVAEGCGQADSLVCPYHSWRYGLDGALRFAPGMGFDEAGFAGHGLLPLRVETWAGLVFVTYSETVVGLHQWLGNIPAQFAAFAAVDLACTRRVQYNVACNWKLLLENALEAYHTGSVHRDTLGQQSSKPALAQGSWTGLVVESDASVAVLPGEHAGLEAFAESALGRIGGTVFTVVYPNSQVVFAHDCLWWLRVEPRGVDHCTLELGSCFARAETRKPSFEQWASAYYERWDRATPEDNRIAELQQIGQAAEMRPAGPFAATEHAVHAFDRWLVHKMGLVT